MTGETRMFREAAEAAAAVRTLCRDNRELAARIGARVRALEPRAVITCARGSSDHAATFAKYLIETLTGVPVSSAAPSTTSVYEAHARMDSVLYLAISQSGASPDLVAAAQGARAAGALVLALVNEVDSRLARTADVTLPLRAGPETSVAATKSFIAALAGALQLVAAWTDDADLDSALESAPELLAEAWQLDWSAAVEPLRTAENLYVVGRGLGLGVAQEAALKLKETCGLHAEALSAAELRHGPMALVRPGFPVFAFVQNDRTRGGVEALLTDLCAAGAIVVVAGATSSGSITLPTLRAHAAVEPMLMIQSFYRLVNGLALARGRDPDSPPHLSKVTETV